MIKRKKITPQDFLNKLFAQYRALNAAKSSIEKLKAEYIKKYCRYRIGNEIKLPEPTEELYTSFVIVKIDVDITSKKTNKKEFTIEFVYEGYYQGESGKGKIIRLKPKPSIQKADQALEKN